MLVYRKKRFSGYDSIPQGTNYLGNLSKKSLNKVLDNTEELTEWAEKTPGIDKASKRIRKKIGGYISPLRKLINK